MEFNLGKNVIISIAEVPVYKEDTDYGKTKTFNPGRKIPYFKPTGFQQFLQGNRKGIRKGWYHDFQRN